MGLAACGHYVKGIDTLWSRLYIKSVHEVIYEFVFTQKLWKKWSWNKEIHCLRIKKNVATMKRGGWVIPIPITTSRPKEWWGKPKDTNIRSSFAIYKEITIFRLGYKRKFLRKICVIEVRTNFVLRVWFPKSHECSPFIRTSQHQVNPILCNWYFLFCFPAKG